MGYRIKLLMGLLLFYPLVVLGCNKGMESGKIDFKLVVEEGIPGEGEFNPEEGKFDPEPIPTGNLALIMDRLKDPESNHVMICAHRGLKDLYPENSLSGIQKCIELGIEAVEIDIAKTKDGKLILMHDGTLDRTTTGSGKVSDYTFDDIKKLFLKDVNGNVTNERVPSFEETLDLAKGNILLQIDKWNGLTSYILPILREKQCLQQAIFRSTSPYEHIRSTFKEYLDKVIFIPVIAADRAEAQNILNGYIQNMPEIRVISIVFSEPNNTILNQVDELKKNYRIWFNAISSKDSGGHDDTFAETNPDESYGWLVKRGANIIFSSNAIKLNEYLKGVGLR